MFVIYKLIKLLDTGKSKIISRNLIFWGLLIAATGHIATVNIATTYHDISATTLVLAAIYIILKKTVSRPYQFFAGILIGVACSIKVQWSIFAIAAGLCIIFCKNMYKNPYKVLLSVMIGGFIGLGIYSGFWFYKIYQLFGNPVFPYMNNIFKSDFADLILLDKGTMQYPENIIQTIFWPFYLFLYQKDGLRDARLSILFISIPFYILFFIVLKEKIQKIVKIFSRYVNFRYFNFLVIFFILSYIFWMFLCPYSRYIMPAESLSGIFIFAIILLILIFLKKVKYLTLCMSVIFIFLLLTTKTSLSHRTQFSDKILYFDDGKIEDNSIVLVSNLYIIPSAVVPFQNPKARYYIFPGLYESKEAEYSSKIIDESAKNSLYFLFQIPEEVDLSDAIDIFKAALKDFPFGYISCKRINSNIDINIQLCRVKKKGEEIE